MVGTALLRGEAEPARLPPVLATSIPKWRRDGEQQCRGGDTSRKRCAIYTRKSSEEGLEQEFNSLAAQREACEAYIRSQQHEGWHLARNRYDDGGFSGGTMERPALQGLLADIRAGRIDILVVYKVDRLTRSLADFARLVEIFDAHFREVGLHQCPSERKGEGVPVCSLRVPSHVPSHPQTAAKVRGFSPIASGFPAEAD